jgi:hypothetical protein
MGRSSGFLTSLAPSHPHSFGDSGLARATARGYSGGSALESLASGGITSFPYDPLNVQLLASLRDEHQRVKREILFPLDMLFPTKPKKADLLS